MTLWLPFLDRGLSYRAWAFELSLLTKQPQCVNYYQLDRNQIAGISYHSNIQFHPLNKDARQCDWLLVKANSSTKFESSEEEKIWTFLQLSQRPGDKKDLLKIYQRVSPRP